MQSLAEAKIDKSLVGDIAYSRNDMIGDVVAQSIRRNNLDRALIMGNVYKRKVVIKFANRYGQRLSTEATVWAVTENHVMLKGGKIIPIRSIYEVDV
ncbi:MAG: hypothetical protein AAFN93_14440 [Bacteroidota bacterium]